LKCIKLKEKNKSKSGERSRRLLDSNLRREWKWKSLKEKKELSKLELSRKLLGLSMKRDLS
jgi:hypothetical protein